MQFGFTPVGSVSRLLLLASFATWPLACLGPAGTLEAPMDAHAAIPPEKPLEQPAPSAQHASVTVAHPLDSDGAAADASAPVFPSLSYGVCTWGPPSATPPLSPLGNAACKAPLSPSSDDLESRIFMITSYVRMWEAALQRIRADDTKRPRVLFNTARGYADLECLENELCARAVTSGSGEDEAAARAARDRMYALCSELAGARAPAWRCP